MYAVEQPDKFLTLWLCQTLNISFYPLIPTQFFWQVVLVGMMKTRTCRVILFKKWWEKEDAHTAFRDKLLFIVSLLPLHETISYTFSAAQACKEKQVLAELLLTLSHATDHNFALVQDMITPGTHRWVSSCFSYYQDQDSCYYVLCAAVIVSVFQT